MRLILDQDQVICKWVERVLEWYNEDYGTSFTRDDVKDYWAMETILGPQGKPFLRSCMRYPRLYDYLDPVEGAVEGIKTLMDKGHDIIIATAVPPSAYDAWGGKVEWTRRNMPFFPIKNLMLAQRKDVIKGDLLLDDGPHNIKAWKKSGQYAVVFDCPWNQDVAGDQRVKNWDEFIQLVDRMQHNIDVMNAVARNGT